MENLVDRGKCRAIGLSDVNVGQVRDIFDQSRIKPSVIQVEAHPYLPENEILEFCISNKVVMLAFAPLGHGIRPGVLDNPVVVRIAHQLNRTPAQVLLSWGIQRGTAVLTTPRSSDRARENFQVSVLPQAAMEEISAIQIRERLNLVTGTGIPRFIAKGN